MDHPNARERMPNPNYPANNQQQQQQHPQQQQASPTYQSFLSQPPPQQPPFDPFRSHVAHRDPFLPSLSKRDPLPPVGRYSDSQLPDPPHSHHAPPHSPFRTGPVPLYQDARRGSGGGAYRSGPMEPPPAPLSSSSIFTRHMPPPTSSPKRDVAMPLSNSSSSSKPSLFEQYSSRGPPDYDAGRARIGSGAMSINSIVDSGPSTSQPAWSPYLRRPSPPPPTTARTTPSSPRNREYNPRHDTTTPSYPKLGASEGRMFGDLDRNHNPVRSPGRPTVTDDDRNGVHGFSRLLQQFSRSPPQPAPTQLPRPLSQPVARELDYVPPSLAGSVERHSQEPRRYDLERLNRDAFQANGIRDGALSDLDGRRSILNHSFSRPEESSYAPKNLNTEETMSRFASRPSYSAEVLERPYQPRAEATQYAPIHSGRRPEERDISPLSTTREHYFRYPESHTASEAPSRISDSSRRDLSRLPEYKNPPPSLFGDRTYRKEKIAEENQTRARPYLNPQNDYGRNERSSPLPQAVQGAQSQPAASGRDPGIKSEFGKMFSGLGRGVGSTPQPSVPNGNGRSPFQLDRDRTPSIKSLTNHVETMKTSNVGPRGGKRGKRPLADEVRNEDDSADGRLISATSTGRATKRNKYTEPLPPPQASQLSQVPVLHHHHHVPGLVHHHHIRKPDDEYAPRGPINNKNYRFPTPTQTVISQPHYHPLGPHHHHPPPPPIARPASPIPQLRVNYFAAVSAIAGTARHHLGSQLYKPNAEMPPTAATTIDSAHTYDLAPNTIPRFDRSKANSTFTVIIPRYWLTRPQRRIITASRRIWGTDIYTDDSDPVAAAMHSGFIRGAWHADVDENFLLGLDPPSTSTEDEPRKPTQELDPGRTLNCPPSTEDGGPVVPPCNRDARITLIILPPLEKYDGTVMHGLKSGTWGGNHDGMSFKLEKVEWVDGVVNERGMVGKKARMLARRKLEKVTTSLVSVH